ncbi:hypothetical protein KC131_15185 [Pseudomonas sp. JQ170]|uniref:hypothetical protein n=1 Tax=unclassified Pseudomonas TaxID=196821 RepID=UPI00264B0A31|nr:MULTISPECIES: hypothetical protein [unclassified Pseudomonas]MDN7141990.1 hypothetical protein [Pseudomonas sp. JQ170]WRO78288.1 hypothetical protein U9R80_11650 [Pseudomonas sp. 170C]
MKTQRPTKQTCSHRCYMQRYRAKPKQSTDTPIQQAEPMTPNEQAGFDDQSDQSPIEVFEESKAIVQQYLNLLLQKSNRKEINECLS